jgi:uncharacterized tellurite resistance protein B-like protein
MENPVRNLYYALGEACYAIAMSDGAVQAEERIKLTEILKKEFSKTISNETEETEIIFHILKKEGASGKTAFNWAIKELAANSHYLSADLKCHFISTLIKVAGSFPPITGAEKDMLLEFISRILDIKEDLVLSQSTSDKD